MPIPNVARQQKEQKVAPQVRTEYHNLSLTITQSDVDTSGAYIQTISFDNRYYDQPAIIMGISSASYKDADTGDMYKTHFISTLKEYLVSPSGGLFVGAKIFIRPNALPNKLTYPITGSISLIVVGRGTEQYMGALEDAIPMLPEDATIHDDDKELELDAPLAPTNLVLTAGLYSDPTDKQQSSYGYIKASWDAVLHNDLQGYESDISEGDNLHYDGLPDPKFNSATYMNWIQLKRDTVYYVRVRAVDLHGNVSAWTESHITTAKESTVAPPTNVIIGEQPPLGVVVTWTASTTPTVILYEVNMASVPHGSAPPNFDVSTKVAEVSTTFYMITNLNTNYDYYFWVRAVTSMGNYSVWIATSGQQPHLVMSEKIDAGAITAEKIAAGAVFGVSIADGAITVDKIATAAITAEKLATNAVTGDKIAAGAVIADKIASGSIVSDKIAAGAVLANSLAAGSVIADKIATDAVTAIKIAAGAITAEKIAAGTITADRIAAGTITASSACIASLDASKITTGYLSANRISGGTITGCDLLTETYYDYKIRIQGYALTNIPQIQFHYLNITRTYLTLSNSGADFNITNTQGDTYLRVSSGHTVYLNGSADINKALVAGSGTAGNHVLYGTTTITGKLTINSGLAFGITGCELNVSSGALKFSDGTNTIYFRYNNSKIEGSVNGSNWYALW